VIVLSKKPISLSKSTRFVSLEKREMQGVLNAEEKRELEKIRGLIKSVESPKNFSTKTPRNPLNKKSIENVLKEEFSKFSEIKRGRNVFWNKKFKPHT